MDRRVGTMKNSYLTVTDQFEEIPKQDPNEPSEAWVQGWDDFMKHGISAINPYPEFTDDHRNWLDGFQCADID